MLPDRILNRIPFFRNKRKGDFIGKLKYGNPHIRFRDHSTIPVGAFLVVSDYRGFTHMFILVGPNQWRVTSSGTSLGATLDFSQTEQYLTDLRNAKMKLRETMIIKDEGRYLALNYDQQDSIAGYL